MRIVRASGSRRALLALAVLPILLVPARADAAVQGFAGECVVNGLLDFTTAPVPVPPLSSLFTYTTINGSCQYGLTAASFSMPTTLLSNVGAPGPCNSGVYTGSGWVDTYTFHGPVTVELVIVGLTANVTIVGGITLAATGVLQTTAVGCPSDPGSWTGVLVVEDPTLD